MEYTKTVRTTFAPVRCPVCGGMDLDAAFDESRRVRSFLWGGLLGFLRDSDSPDAAMEPVTTVDVSGRYTGERSNIIFYSICLTMNGEDARSLGAD